ncbi:hypothetical protein PR202_ga22856 [Eleusine coracana subsp. coracana]|uniref:glutathione transferase n=1 Tax=Eleusine coracana subsp. coracana TaxID=191504 RepID=A0AAV5D508_ELECO|nr:hypothetical protein PR202_ga22856 [Eleusine coracana subsp. coracana]
MSPVKVFRLAAFSNVARVLVCLEEAGAEYEIVEVDFHAKEHKSPKCMFWLRVGLLRADHSPWSRFQPFGQVPAFQDGDLMLFGEFLASSFELQVKFIPSKWRYILLLMPIELIFSESRAICRYVLRKYTATTADGTNLLGDGINAAAAVDAWLDYCHKIYCRRGTPDEEIIAGSVEKLRKVLEVYEARLAEHRYLAGDFVSLADLSHFPYTSYFMGMPYASVFDAFPRVKAWWEDVLARPAVHKVAAMMADHSGS